jgi:hypothetical protein
MRKSGSCRIFSTHRLILVIPELKKSPIAKLRRLAILAGPCPARMVERSSPKTISF